MVPEFLYSQLNRWVPFKPEALKRMLDEMVQDAGVDVRFFTRVIDAEATDGKDRRRGHQQHRGLSIHPRQGIHRLPPEMRAVGPCGAECKIDPAR